MRGTAERTPSLNTDVSMEILMDDDISQDNGEWIKAVPKPHDPAPPPG